MATAATQDLDGVTVLPQLLAYLHGPAGAGRGVARCSRSCRTGSRAGAHRKKAVRRRHPVRPRGSGRDRRHADPARHPRHLRPAARRRAASGRSARTAARRTEGYSILPMPFVNTPNSGGAHLGSAFDAGYEGYLLKTLRAAARPDPSPPGSACDHQSKWCGGGPASCRSAIDGALAKAYAALVTANGGSTNVASWTLSPDAAAAKQTMPVVRRDPVPRARHRRAAGHRLAEPSDLPAGCELPPTPRSLKSPSAGASPFGAISRGFRPVRLDSGAQKAVVETPGQRGAAFMVADPRSASLRSAESRSAPRRVEGGENASPVDTVPQVTVTPG